MLRLLFYVLKRITVARQAVFIMAFMVPKKRTKIGDNYRPEIGLTKKQHRGQVISYMERNLSYYNIIIYYTSNCTA